MRKALNKLVDGSPNRRRHLDNIQKIIPQNTTTSNRLIVYVMFKIRVP